MARFALDTVTNVVRLLAKQEGIELRTIDGMSAMRTPGSDSVRYTFKGTSKAGAVNYAYLQLSADCLDMSTPQLGDLLLREVRACAKLIWEAGMEGKEKGRTISDATPSPTSNELGEIAP